MSNEYGSIVLSSVVHNISSDSEPFVTSQPVPNTSRGTNALGAAALNALEAAEYGRPKKSFSDSILDLAGGVLPAVRFGTWGWVKARAADTVLILELAVQLWTYLGVGWRWTVSFSRLLLYAMLLMPGFIQMVFFYYFSPRVLRSIAYGKGPRQRLDMYMPKRTPAARAGAGGESHPVVIFITGGAWTIGYKAWGALLANRLSSEGMLVACLDYRNFPQGSAMDMLEDVNTGIAWTLRMCHHYRGDPDNVTLVGQSAGGHLGMLALMRQAEQAAGMVGVVGAQPAWCPRDVHAFVGVSGVYDLGGLAEHLHRRGLYKNLFCQIMSIDGQPALDRLSPLAVARGWGRESAVVGHMPAATLVHGTRDKSAPHVGSVQLHEALLASGAESSCQLAAGKTHTSFLLEGPMQGGRDLLMDVMMEVVKGPHNVQSPRVYRGLCPKLLCDLAGWVCPF